MIKRVTKEELKALATSLFKPIIDEHRVELSILTSKVHAEKMAREQQKEELDSYARKQREILAKLNAELDGFKVHKMELVNLISEFKSIRSSMNNALSELQIKQGELDRKQRAIAKQNINIFAKLANMENE